MPEVAADSNAWWNDGGVLMHVGPHKTGTTGLQHSLAAARPGLAEQSVLYPGKGMSHYRATRERVNGSPERWLEIVREIQEQDHRAIISSEYLDRVDQELAPEIVAELGGRVRILITLRPLTNIIPSLWQQHVKSGTAADLAPWAEDLFLRRSDHVSWRSVDHLGLIRQWQEVVGEDKVLILIAESRNPEVLLHGFEDAVGIARGTLSSPDRVNRSMSATESALALALNRKVVDSGMTVKQQVRWIRRGIYAPLVEERKVPPGEPKLVLPQSMQDEVARRQTEIVELLRSSGSRVVGDPETLKLSDGKVADVGPAESVAADAIPMDLAMSVISALLDQALVSEDEHRQKTDRLRIKLRRQKERRSGSRRKRSRWPWQR